MKTIGAFDAKTHFSELLRNVENGDTYEIRKRGKIVAKLTNAVVGHGERELREILGYFKNIREHASASYAEINSWKNEGRR